MTPGRRGWIDVLLGVPLSHKLVAASVAVAAVVAAVTLLTVRQVTALQAAPDGLVIAGAFAVGGVLLAILHGALVRLALRPIRELERVAARVKAGDFSARVEPTLFADRQLEQVAGQFNDALDGITELRVRLREVARRSVERRGEERRAVAGHLQEDVAQRIAACLLKLKVARAPADDEARNALLDELREDAASVLESVRGLARDLHPPELADIGVGRAIQAFARSFAESTGIDVEMDRDPVNGVLDEEGRLALYRIAQDLLMNVVQRTECRDVHMRLRASPDRVTLELAGHVRGPSMSARWADSPELTEIRERASYVGGRVVADGPSGRGRIRVELPAAVGGGGAAPAAVAG